MMTGWRDVDNPTRQIGFYLYVTGLTVYAGRRTYRLLWWNR